MIWQSGTSVFTRLRQALIDDAALAWIFGLIEPTPKALPHGFRLGGEPSSKPVLAASLYHYAQPATGKVVGYGARLAMSRQGSGILVELVARVQPRAHHAEKRSEAS